MKWNKKIITLVASTVIVAVLTAGGVTGGVLLGNAHTKTLATPDLAGQAQPVQSSTGTVHTINVSVPTGLLPAASWQRNHWTNSNSDLNKQMASITSSLKPSDTVKLTMSGGPASVRPSNDVKGGIQTAETMAGNSAAKALINKINNTEGASLEFKGNNVASPQFMKGLEEGFKKQGINLKPDKIVQQGSAKPPSPPPPSTPPSPPPQNPEPPAPPPQPPTNPEPPPQNPEPQPEPEPPPPPPKTATTDETIEKFNESMPQQDNNNNPLNKGPDQNPTQTDSETGEEKKQNPNFPDPSDNPLGYVEIDGKKYPVLGMGTDPTKGYKSM